MRVIVVGLGVQGAKRKTVRWARFRRRGRSRSTPRPSSAALQDVPLERYDAALCCIPDEPKIELLTYLVEHGKHVLVEKPLWAADDAEIGRLEALAREQRRCALHRLQPPLRAALRAHARPDRQRRARARSIAAACSTATARRGWCANSAWRDHGAGVLPDLGSHLLDTARFWFGDLGDDFSVVVSADRFENRAPDHVVIARRRGAAAARTRNDAAQLAQPLHLRRLRRARQRAHQLAVQVGSDDVHACARACCRRGGRRRRRSRWCRTIRPGRSNTSTSRAWWQARRQTDLGNDLWLQRAAARGSATRRSAQGEPMSTPVHRLRRHDAPRPRLGRGGGSQGLRRRSASTPTRR